MKKAPEGAFAVVLDAGFAQAAIVQHIIMPPQPIIIGMPLFIIDIMRLQHSVNMAMSMPSIGFISHIMPSAVIEQVIVPIIMGIGIIIGIMPFIMGMPPIIGIMAPIIGFIMPFIIGIIPPIIGWFMPPMPIIGIMFIALFIIGISWRPSFSLETENPDKSTNIASQYRKIVFETFL